MRADAAAAKLYPFDFEAIVPMPDDLAAAAIAEEDQLNTLYDYPVISDVRVEWRLKHWGCKWEPEMSLVADEPERLAVRMHTPWSPPCDVLKALSEHFPELEFGIVAHDSEMPYALAWRSVAGLDFDQEACDSGLATGDDLYAECDDWVAARIRRFEELPTA